MASLSGPGRGRHLPKMRSPSHSHLLKAAEVEEEEKIDFNKCKMVAESSEMGGWEGNDDRNESNWERRLLPLPFKLPASENLLQTLRATVMRSSSILLTGPRQVPWRGSYGGLTVHVCI